MRRQREAGQAFAVVEGPEGGDPTVVPFVDGRLCLDACGKPAKEGILVLRWEDDAACVEVGEGAFIAGRAIEPPARLKAGEDLRIARLQVVVALTADIGAAQRRTLTHYEFRERLYEELARARRSGRSTALVMVAAKAGEGRRVGAAALAAFRAGDLAATYAPDQPEFLLTDTDGETARAVVARVFESAGVRAAVGIAVAPNDGETAERLMRAARKAVAEGLRMRDEGDETTFAMARSHHPSLIDASAERVPVASDDATLALLSRVHELALRSEAVLLRGETSVGKSVYARMLHRESGASGRFVSRHGATFRCDELDETLAEAAGGVLFLEEIAELSLEDQTRLADAEAAFGRARVRLIASTEHSLKELAERDAFDGKLATIFGASVAIPPLRERGDDILPLARSFVRSAAPVRFSAGAVARLRAYPWPGNVLELANAIERAVHLASDGVILGEHLPSEPASGDAGEGQLRAHMGGVERDAIVRALAETNHNQTHAARRLGVSRRALIYKMEKYGLKRPPRSAREKKAP